MRRSDRNRGQALIEFALIVPLLFLLIVNAINFAGYLYAGVTVANAARGGADYLMLGPANIGGHPLPSLAQVTAQVTADLISLPNRASASITVCTNNNGSIQSPGTCLATVTDPQSGTSVVGQVQVTYTYVPLIAAFNFNKLGIHLTLPATTIRRTATCRLLQ
ncbi:MAG TPA: TadE/TadG family type IV pilus assembly protein [Bryobacteraceae bacterium]